MSKDYKEREGVGKQSCIYCGSDDIREYSEGEIKYDYCFICGEPQTGGPPPPKLKSATIEENTIIEKEKRSDTHSPSKSGYYLMCIGAIIYIIVFFILMIYTPDYEKIQDYLNYTRLMTGLGFGGVIIFMLGSILQTKVLLQ